MLTVAPVANTSEMGIIFWADDRIEGTEVLTLQLTLTSPTQNTIDNAGNIFFRDTSTIRVIDSTGITINTLAQLNRVHEDEQQHSIANCIINLGCLTIPSMQQVTLYT